MTLYILSVVLSSVYCDTIVGLLTMIYEYITMGREADIDIVYGAVFVEFLGRRLGQSIARLSVSTNSLVSDLVLRLRLGKFQCQTRSQY